MHHWIGLCHRILWCMRPFVSTDKVFVMWGCHFHSHAAGWKTTPCLLFKSAYLKLLAMALSICLSSTVWWWTVWTWPLKKISVAIISSNTNIIEKDVHWVPLAHDMDQNLTKLANISFLSMNVSCRWFTYISKQMRSW